MADIEKTADEWKSQLTPAAYSVCRKKGTERAFSGEYWDSEKEGTYCCTCCGAELFKSDTKFDSGTGWPSYFAAINDSAVSEKADNTLFRKRTEVVCTACDSHLGHVFPDGPPPSGKRFCINSVSLQLRPDA